MYRLLNRKNDSLIKVEKNNIVKYDIYHINLR